MFAIGTPVLYHDKDKLVPGVVVQVFERKGPDGLPVRDPGGNVIPHYKLGLFRSSGYHVASAPEGRRKGCCEALRGLDGRQVEETARRRLGGPVGPGALPGSGDESGEDE